MAESNKKDSIPKASIARIMKEYSKSLKDGKVSSDFPQGLYVGPPNETNIEKAKILITGPPDSQFEGAIFFMDMNLAGYPFVHPTIKNHTTNYGTYSYHHHYYTNGKVCVDILGTNGPSKWTSSYGFAAILLSIQQLLNDSNSVSSDFYFALLNNSICDNIEKPPPGFDCFNYITHKLFLDKFEYYYKLANKIGDYRIKVIQDRLFAIKQKLEKK